MAPSARQFSTSIVKSREGSIHGFGALRRSVAKLRRIELADDVATLSKPHSPHSCTSKEDCHLDAEKATRQFSERGRKMYKLRDAGFEWREIAAILNTTDAAVRAEFSRELKRARLKVKNNSKS